MAALKELLRKIDHECICGTLEREVTDIIYDSRKVVPGSMFVCIPGAVVDGHKFAGDAVKAGAGVLLVEKDVELPEGPVSVKVTSACTKSRLEFQGDVPSALKLTCKVEVRLSEYRTRPDGQGVESLRTEAARRERVRLEGALEQLRAWGTDCAGLGAKAGMFHPARWQAVQADWPEWFSRVPLEITVEVEIL